MTATAPHQMAGVLFLLPLMRVVGRAHAGVTAVADVRVHVRLPLRAPQCRWAAKADMRHQGIFGHECVHDAWLPELRVFNISCVFAVCLPVRLAMTHAPRANSKSASRYCFSFQDRPVTAFQA